MKNSLLGSAVKDIAIYFPGKLLPAMAAFVMLPIYARIFSPEEYGILAVIGVFTSAGGIAVGNWLTSCVIRFLPAYRREGSLENFYSTLFGAFAISIIAFFCLIFPAYFLIRSTVSESVYQLLPLAGLLIIINSLYSIFQTILRADRQSKQFVGFELFQVFGALTIGLCIILLFKFGVEGILLGSLTTLLISCIGIGIFLYRQGVRISGNCFSVHTLRDFATYGLPGGIATLGTWILSLSDRYIIEFFRGTMEVGQYSMGYNVADKTVNLIVSSLMLAIGPVLINTWESEFRENTSKLLGQITRITLILVFPMVVGLSVLAMPIFRVLTTESYFPGARVLPWVALGALFYGLSLQAYTGLIVEKKTVQMARNYLMAGFINVALNIIFIPRLGFIAAAMNTAISYALLLMFNVISANKYLSWLFPWKSLGKIGASVSIMAIPLWLGVRFFDINLFLLVIGVMIGATLYFSALVIVGEITLEEYQSIKRAATQGYRHFFTFLSKYRSKKGER